MITRAMVGLDHECNAWCHGDEHAELVYVISPDRRPALCRWLINGRDADVIRAEPAPEAPPACPTGRGQRWAAWTVWFRWAD